MPGTAPFQLWIDGPALSSVIVASGTATITTKSSHFFVTGSYVQFEGLTGTAGTPLNSVFQITSTSGTTFTFATATAAGTATSGSAVVSVDILQPVGNYAAANRQAAVYADPGSLSMSASGDGQPGEMGFFAMQDDTPATGAWFTLIPDQARVRLARKDTGSAPASTDIYFIGIVQSLDAEMNGSGQGTMANFSCADANVVLDKLIIFGTLPKPV